MSKICKTLSNTKDPDKMIAEILGQRYKEYRRRWMRAEKSELFKYPIHLDFELSFGCTLSCKQCIIQIPQDELSPDHPYHKNNRKKTISFAKFKKIIDDGVGLGLCSITLNVNNEPLLVPDITRYIRYAKKAGVLDIIMLTNATLLTRKVSKELLASGLTKIYFSLDAIKEDTYRKVRRGGDLKKTMANINYFLQLKKKRKLPLPITRVSFVKSKANESELREFIRYWEKRVDFVSVQAFMNPAYGYSNYKALQKGFYIENEELKKSGKCAQPYQRLTINNDGSVHPCCLWYGILFDLGNIHNMSIYDIWNSNKMKKFREDVNSKDVELHPKICNICREVNFG